MTFELTPVITPEMFTGEVAQPPSRVLVDQASMGVTEAVTIRPLPSIEAVQAALDGQQPVINTRPVAITHVSAVAEADWTWEQLRDYVVGHIQAVNGVFPRDPDKEMGVFKAFLDRWKSDAVPIARYAFEVMNGYWRNAPISVNRFCKGSDPYFAKVIAAWLHE
jgi:hypothetical protein